MSSDLAETILMPVTMTVVVGPASMSLSLRVGLFLAIAVPFVGLHVAAMLADRALERIDQEGGR